MFYYVLPGTGIYGGVKSGFRCADLLTASGHPCIVATPDGDTPHWFSTTATVIKREDLVSRCGREDEILFSFPPDRRFVNRLPARRRIVDMQGGNTRGDRMLFRGSYEFVTHGLHMSLELLQAGRIAPYVPFGIPDCFRWRGEPKTRGRVVVMSRKGRRFVDAVSAALTTEESLVVVDGLSETEVAETLKGADVFAAISTAEAFGLPPLEAMCAGCCVVGFPGDGGLEFMRHGETAHLVPNADARALGLAVREALDRPGYRDALRSRAMDVSRFYTMERQREYLLRALGLTME